MSQKFEIIKKKNLPDEAQIIGFSFLKKPTDKDKQKKKFDFTEKSNSQEIGCKLPKRKSWAYTKGYVKVDNKPNIFVEVKSRLLIIILLFGLGIGLLAGMFAITTGDDPIIDMPSLGDFVVSDDRQTQPTEETEQTDTPTITFSGYGKYTVSNDSPNVELYNPDINFVDMVFTLTDEITGEIIARTGRVPAGKYVYVNVMDFYTEPGVYNILINVATFDAETGAQMNGINQKMEVTVK